MKLKENSKILNSTKKIISYGLFCGRSRLDYLDEEAATNTRY